MTKNKAQIGRNPPKGRLPGERERGRDDWIMCTPVNLAQLVVWVSNQAETPGSEFVHYVGEKVPGTRISVARVSTTVHIDGQTTHDYASPDGQTCENDHVAISLVAPTETGVIQGVLLPDGEVSVTRFRRAWARHLVRGNLPEWIKRADETLTGAAVPGARP